MLAPSVVPLSGAFGLHPHLHRFIHGTVTVLSEHNVTVSRALPDEYTGKMNSAQDNVEGPSCMPFDYAIYCPRLEASRAHRPPERAGRGRELGRVGKLGREHHRAPSQSGHPERGHRVAAGEPREDSTRLQCPHCRRRGIGNSYMHNICFRAIF
jgi:hypothetical protein